MRLTTKNLASSIYGKVDKFCDDNGDPIWFVKPTGHGLDQAYALLERKGLIVWNEAKNLCRFRSGDFSRSPARLKDCEILDAKTTSQPRQRLTVDGYTKRGGSPTAIMVKIDGFGDRWRRVYVICFSNSGSLFVKIDGIDYFLDLTSHDLAEFEAKRQRGE